MVVTCPTEIDKVDWGEVGLKHSRLYDLANADTTTQVPSRYKCTSTRTHTQFQIRSIGVHHYHGHAAAALNHLVRAHLRAPCPSNGVRGRRNCVYYRRTPHILEEHKRKTLQNLSEAKECDQEDNIAAKFSCHDIYLSYHVKVCNMHDDII